MTALVPSKMLGSLYVLKKNYLVFPFQLPKEEIILSPSTLFLFLLYPNGLSIPVKLPN